MAGASTVRALVGACASVEVTGPWEGDREGPNPLAAVIAVAAGRILVLVLGGWVGDLAVGGTTTGGATACWIGANSRAPLGVVTSPKDDTVGPWVGGAVAGVLAPTGGCVAANPCAVEGTVKGGCVVGGSVVGGRTGGDALTPWRP